MKGKLQSLLSRGNYTLPIRGYSANVQSMQVEGRHQTRAEIYLRCSREGASWPTSHFPTEVRIVAAPIADYDRTSDDQLMLGLIRCDQPDHTVIWLLAQESYAAQALALLNHGTDGLVLSIETHRKVEEWGGDEFIPVLSFSVARKSAYAADET